MISLSYQSPNTAPSRQHRPAPPPPTNGPPTAPPPHPSVPPPAYSETKPVEEGDQVTILLKCPKVSSYLWCIKLYATVCGGCGSILSFLWLIGHLYVLFQTQDSELKTQRYVDILLGLCLLVSQVLLCYSSIRKKRETLTLFFILSMAVLILYWVWFAYLKYGKGESEASKEVSDTGRFLTIFYLVLLLPILLLYRTLSKEKANDRMSADEEEIKSLM